MDTLNARHANQSQKHVNRKGMYADRVKRELGREIPALIVTSPVVVPVWWLIWKFCDELWRLK